MLTSADKLRAVADELSLTGESPDGRYGSWGGYPMAVTSLADSGAFGLLFQIRHHVPAESLPDEEVFDWGGELGRLIAEGKAKVEVEDRIAWITLYDARVLVECGCVPDIVDTVLSGLAAAGIESLGDTCHYCLTDKVEVIRYEHGRVAQVCDACLAERFGIRAEQKRVSAGGFLAACLVGLLASPVGAVAWAACWIAYMWVVDLISGDKDAIAVPLLVTIGQVLLFGWLTGGAVGFSISRIPKRGYHSAGLIGAASGLGAIVIGEVLLGFWIAMYILDGLSVQNVVGGAIAGWFMDPLTRLATIVVTLCVAYVVARPKVDPLGL